MQKLFYSMREVCVAFGVSRSTIDRWEVESGFPKRVYLGHVGVVRLHDKTTRRFLRTKRSNCRIGFPCSEVDAWAQARMDARKPLKEGVKPSF
jgi:predicted DNA-binding transcriptional regulator AlpA